MLSRFPNHKKIAAKWLERMVTSLHLAELVGELKAVHGSGGTDNLSTILGDSLPDVLNRGLGELSSRQLRSLLTQPESLFDLQAEVLVSGSPYWQHVSNQDKDVAKFVGSGSTIVAKADAASEGSVDRASAFEPRQNWYKHPMLVAIATAAAVLLAVNLSGYFGAEQQEDSVKVAAVTAWGWDAQDAIKSDVTASAYLNGLADSAEEWFKKRPANSRDVAIRIAQLRQGCSTLILSDHQPLADEDRTWLVEKCRSWAEKLDAHLAAAETGETPITVRDATDVTVRKIITVMRERAGELA